MSYDISRTSCRDERGNVDLMYESDHVMIVGWSCMIPSAGAICNRNLQDSEGKTWAIAKVPGQTCAYGNVQWAQNTSLKFEARKPEMQRVT